MSSEPEEPHFDVDTPFSSQARKSFAGFPAELMEQIFAFYAPGNILDISTGRVRTNITRLCLVCRRWREIAYACPTLWGVLRLTNKQLGRMDIVKDWVKRSGRCPLSLGIWTEAVGHINEDIAWSALQIFTTPNEMEMTSRIQEILIHASNISVSRKDDAPSNAQFPSLKVLDVCLEGDFWDVIDGNFGVTNSPRFLENIPANSPVLESLTWRGLNCTRVLSNLLHPPSNVISQAATLTSVKIEDSLSYLECIDILASFPHLRHCVLERIRNYDDLQVSPYRLSLDAFDLKHLTLIGDFNLLFILTKLAAPSLCSLTIAIVGTNVLRSLSTLSSFLLRSTPPLGELRITNIHLDEEECKTCLRSIPTLEILDIYDEHMNTNGPRIHGILGALSMPQPPSTSKASFICPILRSLVLRGDIAAPDGVLAEIVGCRLGDTGVDFCLEKVLVEFNEKGHNVDKLKAKELVEKAKTLNKNLVMKVFVRC